MNSILDTYYGKFCEDKRLTRRHGQVEYVTSMKYIHDCLQELPHAKILDVGAGTGRYSVPLANEGYDVTAIELVKYNLGMLKAKGSSAKAYQGTALDLSRFEDNSFDLTLVFGPMYHLYTFEDKLQALNEAKRVTKVGGRILVAYCMNEFSIITYGFKQQHMRDIIKDGKVTEDYQTISSPEDLYSYVRVDDIYQLSKGAGLNREKLISADGPANYMRAELKALDEEMFQMFLNYHLATCERPELLGAAAHTLDILRK